MQRLWLLVVGLAASLAYASGGMASPPASPGGEVRHVELDGHRVRVRAIGLESRRPGTPVVVFEAGATNSLDAWTAVVPLVAPLAPVVAYDRAGLGESEWDGLEPTPRHVTDRLRRLLGEIGAEPPYLLVGHSWGGMLAHYYAGWHPAEVAGLVLVDPAPVLTQEPSGNLAPFEAIGSDRAGHDAYWAAFRTLLANASPAIRAEFATFTDLLDRERAARDLQPLPPVPMVVIVAGRYLPLPILDGLPFDARRHFDADLRHRIGLLQEWALASPDGVLLVSNRTTHAIPREAPDLVAWAIARVLASSERARSGNERGD